MTIYKFKDTGMKKIILLIVVIIGYQILANAKLSQLDGIWDSSTYNQ